MPRKSSRRNSGVDFKGENRSLATTIRQNYRIYAIVPPVNYRIYTLC